MQYKIPLQIENEDIIVAGLSLRQLVILMVWGGLAYTVFKSTESRVGPEIGLALSLPIALIGVTIALMKIAEMTFLPIVLNFFRLTLNARSRVWSQGTDGFSDTEIGYIAMTSQREKAESNKSLESVMGQNEQVNENILKL